MAKSAMFSWRISPELKSALEVESRRERASVAGLLDRIANEWLQARRQTGAWDAVEQAGLQREAAKTLGSIAGGDAHRAENARHTIRERLRRTHVRGRAS